MNILARKKKILKTKSNFINEFFDHELNTWIKADKFIYSSMQEFMDIVPLKVFEKVCLKNPLIISRSSGRYACSVAPIEMNLIILFPEVIRYLSSYNNEIGKAILAHELGHLFHKHSQRKISELEAQIEADAFAVELGYGMALSEFLEGEVQSIDTRVRLTYITSKVLSDS